MNSHKNNAEPYLRAAIADLVRAHTRSSNRHEQTQLEKAIRLVVGTLGCPDYDPWKWR